MATQQNNPSEIARLREQITREHEAACWALKGIASGMAQHHFINQRMRRIEEHHQQLATLVGEEASIAFVNEVFAKSPPQSERSSNEAL